MSNKFFIKIILVFGIIFALCSNFVFATSGKVTGNNVRIRERADSKAPEVSVATKNENVEVIGEDGNWYKVNFEDVTGYISKDYVDTEYSSEASGKNNEDENVSEEEKPVENENNSGNENEEGNSSENGNNSSNENEEENPVENENNSGNENEGDKPAENENNIEGNNTVDEINYQVNQTVTFEKETSLRYLPSFTSRVLKTIESNSTYTIKAVLNNWVKIENETDSGWVLKKEINSSEINENASSNDGDVNKNGTSVNDETANKKETSVNDETANKNENSNNAESTSGNETSNNDNGGSSNNENSNKEETDSRKGTVNVKSAVVRRSPEGDVLES